MNSKQRRQTRRYLDRVWKYTAPWPFIDLEDYRTVFCKEFKAWRKAEGLSAEMCWDWIDYDCIIRFRKEEAYHRYLMRWPSE